MSQNLVRFWTGPLPKEELFPDRKYNPFVHWLYHPILRHLSRTYLKILQKYFNLEVIGVTGSFGKTTTKDMLYAILKNHAPTVASFGNISSTYNIPGTILKCTPLTKYLILEMGVEYKGDMDFYLWLARPDVAIITGIGPTHLEHMGSIENIAYEKNKITKFAKHLVTYQNTKVKHYSLPTDFIGNQFDLNASLAAKTAEILNISNHLISQSLNNFTPPPHRMCLIKLKNNNYLIDDSYNANPEAVKASLTTLIEFSKSKKLTPVFVFGQMNELGSYAISAHQEIGILVKKLGITHFYCLGEATKYSLKSADFGQYFDDLDNLTPEIKKLVTSHKSLVVLIKGSRSWKMEKIIKSLICEK